MRSASKGMSLSLTHPLTGNTHDAWLCCARILSYSPACLPSRTTLGLVEDSSAARLQHFHISIVVFHPIYHFATFSQFGFTHAIFIYYTPGMTMSCRAWLWCRGFHYDRCQRQPHTIDMEYWARTCVLTSASCPCITYSSVYTMPASFPFTYLHGYLQDNTGSLAD